MDSVNCRFTRAYVKQSLPKPRPLVGTLSKLAVLMSRVDHKQESSSRSQPSRSSKDGGQEVSGLNSHRQRKHTLRKPHHCQHCGQEFSLASTLQLHRCVNKPSACRMCRGKRPQGSKCPSCRAEVSGPRNSAEQSHSFNLRLHHDSSPYACAPCGRAFSHKQALLYHQQAGGCQPAPLSPKAFASPPAGTPISPDDASTPSCASLPPSSSRTNDCSVTCRFCLKTFRNSQGLGSHRRLVHKNDLKKAKKVTESGQKSKGTMFPCRSCDKVFPQTSLLYLHRKEEHRRRAPATRQQRSLCKVCRRQKGETYPCLSCGKVFLHHLTRWAHFKSNSAHYQTHLSNSGESAKTHRVHKAAKDRKTANACKVTSTPSKETRFEDERTDENKVTKRSTSKTRRQVVAEKEDAVSRNEAEEFPCPSCEEVFESQSALLHHGDVHQSSHIPKHCSVCTGGIALPEVAKPSVNRVYHCVPCKEAFVDLDTFLQHCKTHFYRSGDDDKDCAQLSE